MDNIRQQYHPIIVHHSQQLSDMKVVTVGTASCAPSMTRCVSCTAIQFGKSSRDEGERNKEAAEKKEKKKAAANHERFLSEYSTRDLASQQIRTYPPKHMMETFGKFQAGIWLFDCGECTQVSSAQVIQHKNG